MTDTAARQRAEGRALSFMDRLPTGAKLLAILSTALLPLAIIAIFATIRTAQEANAEVRARLRIAAAEGSRALSIELIGDMTALRATVDALAIDPLDAPSCARTQGVFAQQFSSGARFVVLDPAGHVLCGRDFAGARGVAKEATGTALSSRLVAPQGVRLGVAARDGRVRGAAFFPRDFLARIAQPGVYAPDYAATLEGDNGDLTLRELDGAPIRRQTTRVALGVGDLVLRMAVRSAPITSPVVIAMLLPLVMWAAAAGIGWFVVDRLMIRPLRQLRAAVAAYKPGEVIDAGALRGVAAQEIRELGETFRAISRTVVLHEAGLAEGLQRQTKLTREVHHRVKNNLQVIASLINLHARGARSPEASQAYASIQRRVDALAVVHRNHFAEMEDNRGLDLHGMVGELAANLRATTPDGSHLGIVVDVDELQVNQDVAVAVAFLVTETIELAMLCDPAARLRISAKPDGQGRALLRVSSPALVDGETLRAGLATRFGRVMEGLSRQLRSKLHHDPLVGAYEIGIAVL